MRIVVTNCILAVTLLSSAVLPSDTSAQVESQNGNEVVAEALQLGTQNSAGVVTEAAPSDEAIDEALRLQSVGASSVSQPGVASTVQSVETSADLAGDAVYDGQPQIHTQIIYQDTGTETSNVVGSVIDQTHIAGASIAGPASLFDAPMDQSVPYECGPIILDGDCARDRGAESDSGTFYDGSTDCGCDRVAPVVPMELRETASSSTCCCVDSNASSVTTSTCTAPPQDSNSNGCAPMRRGLLRRLFGR